MARYSFEWILWTCKQMFFTKIAPELLKGKHIHPAVIITNLYILKPLKLKVLISPYDFIMDAKVDIMYVSSLTVIEYQSLHDDLSITYHESDQKYICNK